MVTFYLIRSAVTGLILTIPFIILELVNRRNENYDFPLVIYLVLWLLASVFVLQANSLYGSIKNKTILTGGYRKPAGKAMVIILVFVLWLLIVNDQLPCFLGIANCD